MSEKQQLELVAIALMDYKLYMSEVQGCSDGYCVIRKPIGMHTNGRCTCTRNDVKMQRLAYASNRLVEALSKIVK